ncbi:MAG: hypothetical protein ACYCRD_05565 [Leptospirillum sp.]
MNIILRKSVKKNDRVLEPGTRIDLTETAALKLIEMGLARKDDSPLPSHVEWESPLYGILSGGPVLEMGETTFTLKHPLTGEILVLSREWLVTMEERAAIFEYEAGLPREEADRKARGMLFNQFRKGGKP